MVIALSVKLYGYTQITTAASPSGAARCCMISQTAATSRRINSGVTAGRRNTVLAEKRTTEQPGELVPYPTPAVDVVLELNTDVRQAHRLTSVDFSTSDYVPQSQLYPTKHYLTLRNEPRYCNRTALDGRRGRLGLYHRGRPISVTSGGPDRRSLAARNRNITGGLVSAWEAVKQAGRTGEEDRRTNIVIRHQWPKWGKWPNKWGENANEQSTLPITLQAGQQRKPTRPYPEVSSVPFVSNPKGTASHLLMGILRRAACYLMVPEARASHLLAPDLAFLPAKISFWHLPV